MSSLLFEILFFLLNLYLLIFLILCLFILCYNYMYVFAYNKYTRILNMCYLIYFLCCIDRCLSSVRACYPRTLQLTNSILGFSIFNIRIFSCDRSLRNHFNAGGAFRTNFTRSSCGIFPLWIPLLT